MFTLPKNYSLFQKEAVVVLTTIFILLLTSVKAQNEVDPGSSSLELTLWIPFQQGRLGPEIFLKNF